MTLLDANVVDFLAIFLANQKQQTVSHADARNVSLPKVHPGFHDCVISAVSNRANMGYPVRRLQLSPSLFADGESFWHSVGVNVEAVVNPLASLPAECRAEEWGVEDEMEGGGIPEQY